MKNDIMESLQVILDIVDNYDACYTKSEITERVLESNINEIIEFTGIVTRDLNRIRNIINESLEDNNV